MISVHARNFLVPKNEEVGPGNLLVTQLHQSAFLWTKKKKKKILQVSAVYIYPEDSIQHVQKFSQESYS